MIQTTKNAVKIVVYDKKLLYTMKTNISLLKEQSHRISPPHVGKYS